MIIFDSNVWVAFFHEVDSQHQKARKVFSALSSKILLPEYVLLEVASVLAKRASKGIADMFIERVIDNEAVELLIFEDKQFLEFCENYRRLPNAKLSFIDAALLTLSVRYDVITFDAELQRMIEA